MSETTPARSQVSGKVALVAGATRGAGRAIAIELARSGAYVYAGGGGRTDHDRADRRTGGHGDHGGGGDSGWLRSEAMGETTSRSRVFSSADSTG